MAAVMHMDRTAYRRLGREWYGVEDRIRAWGRHVRMDRAPCDWPAATPIYKAMRTRNKEWLGAARVDPYEEPDWMPDFVALVREQKPVLQTYLRRRYADGLTQDEARGGLNMSAAKASRIMAEFRSIVRARFGA